jgi:hypothetical protein
MCVTRYHYGMTCPKLLFLIDEMNTRKDFFHRLRLMSDNDGNFAGNTPRSGKHVFDERGAPDLMKDFGLPGFHSGAFTGGKNQRP